MFSDLVTGIGSATNVTYNGGFSPGHSPAEVDLAGIANLAASNTLFIELGGLTPGSQFDRLNSTGTVNVDGTLDVSFINGFTPAAGHSFEIIGATAVNGTFDTANLPTLRSDSIGMSSMRRTRSRSTSSRYRRSSQQRRSMEARPTRTAPASARSG